jgi:glycosyltransferase involved in cell wall biosynthesis
MSSPASSGILLPIYTYPPVIGGSEIEAQRTAAALAQRGYRIRVLCAGGPPMPAARFSDPFGTPVECFGMTLPEPWRGRWYALCTAWRILTLPRETGTVYFLMPGLQVTLGAPLAAWRGKRVLMKFSGSNTISPLANSWLGRQQLKAIRNFADAIMFLNEGMRREALECGLPEAKLVWMPNPVNTDEYAPVSPGEQLRLRQERGLAETDQVVVFVGRLAPEKEIASLVQGFERAVTSIPSARLVLVGDGPLRSQLERQAKDSGLSQRVIFTGMLDPGQARRWLQASNVFALVSSLEGFPVALAEAMAVGLPSVVSDIPANRQLIPEGERGLLVTLKDPVAIGNAITHLLQSPERAAEMGREARKHIVDNYSTAQVIERYEALLTR